MQSLKNDFAVGRADCGKVVSNELFLYVPEPYVAGYIYAYVLYSS